MYSPPPSLKPPNQIPQLFRRGAIFFALLGAIGLLRFLLPFSENIESIVGLILLILSINVLPKADVPIILSLAASMMAFSVLIGIAFLFERYVDVQPELGLAIVGSIESTICWAGYLIAKHRR